MDYLHLHEKFNCRLQIGGSDQWGNITGGLELIRKKNASGQAYALSFPLITDSNGKKFGKSAEGALWLDGRFTSPYKLHQYFLNTDDQDVEKLLKVFTFLSKEEIESVVQSSRQAPEKREAQKRLADEVCNLVHGKEATETAKKSAAVLFGGSLDGIKSEELEAIFADVPSAQISADDLKTKSILELIAQTQLVASKSEARRQLEAGAIYINNVRVAKEEYNQPCSTTPIGNLLVFRSGKKSYQLVKIL